MIRLLPFERNHLHLFPFPALAGRAQELRSHPRAAARSHGPRRAGHVRGRRQPEPGLAPAVVPAAGSRAGEQGAQRGAAHALQPALAAASIAHVRAVGADHSEPLLIPPGRHRALRPARGGHGEEAEHVQVRVPRVGAERRQGVLLPGAGGQPAGGGLVAPLVPPLRQVPPVQSLAPRRADAQCAAVELRHQERGGGGAVARRLRPRARGGGGGGAQGAGSGTRGRVGEEGAAGRVRRGLGEEGALGSLAPV